MNHKYSFVGTIIFVSVIFSSKIVFSQNEPSLFFKYTASKLLNDLKKNQLQGNPEFEISNDLNQRLPRNLSQVIQLFEATCMNGISNRSINQMTKGKDLQQTFLRCPTDDTTELIEFVFTNSISNSKIVDLQVVSSKIAISDFKGADITPVESKRRDSKFQFKAKDGLQVVLSVGLSTLAGGLLSRGIYPGQVDKENHILAGNLIAVAGTLLGYYGFQLNEKHASIVGFGLAVVAGILKEIYDSKHAGRHTVDMNDAVATSLGGILGAGLIRFKFEF